MSRKKSRPDIHRGARPSTVKILPPEKFRYFRQNLVIGVMFHLRFFKEFPHLFVADGKRQYGKTEKIAVFGVALEKSIQVVKTPGGTPCGRRDVAQGKYQLFSHSVLAPNVPTANRKKRFSVNHLSVFAKNTDAKELFW